jgi:hypothetical protein
VFLHNEPDKLKDMKSQIREDYSIYNHCRGRMFQWVDVSEFFGFPDGFSSSGIKKPYPMPHRRDGGSWGYHHMCRFWNREIFHVPHIKQVYEYILRLDTDSLILTPWTSDPFAAMKAKQAVYGYKCISPDFPEYAVGMVNFTKQYAESNNLEPAFRGFRAYLSNAKETLVPMPYTNLEILHVPFFNSPPVARFLNASDTGPVWGVYRHRWGDAPLRAMVLGLFATEMTVRHISEFEYIHPAGALSWSKYKAINASVKNNQFEFVASAWKQEPAKGECSVVNSPSAGYFKKPPHAYK